MKKNLVIIHLESVSQLIYQMNRELFPNIREFQKNCLTYNYYYSTATSTAMVLNDISYGDMARIENTELFGNFIETHKNAEAFPDILEEKGYKTLGIHYPSALGDEINPGHMYSKKNELKNYSDYQKVIFDIENTIQAAEEEKENFMIYFCNEVSHICYSDRKKNHIKNPTERWEYGYRNIDNTAKDVLDILEKKDLFKNTTVIIYGDHGDDFYGHGYNGGFIHSLEPYTNLIHTPFMIFDPEIESGETDEIICALDIKQMVMNLLGLNISETNPYIYDGIHSSRKYVFSRNLFAGQTPSKIRGAISNVKKSYGVATKEYNLILTENGYRLYFSKMDYTNSNNVLDFFRKEGGSLELLTPLEGLQVHYKNFMGNGTVGNIRKAFLNLKKIMEKEIALLEKQTNIYEIVPHSSYGKIHYTKNMMLVFAKIRMQGYKKKAHTYIEKKKVQLWKK